MAVIGPGLGSGCGFYLTPNVTNHDGSQPLPNPTGAVSSAGSVPQAQGRAPRATMPTDLKRQPDSMTKLPTRIEPSWLSGKPMQPHTARTSKAGAEHSNPCHQSQLFSHLPYRRRTAQCYGSRIQNSRQLGTTESERRLQEDSLDGTAGCNQYLDHGSGLPGRSTGTTSNTRCQLQNQSSGTSIAAQHNHCYAKYP